MDKELEEVKNHLGETLLKIDSILENPNTTKSFVYINGLNFARNNIKEALKQVFWLEDNETP